MRTLEQALYDHELIVLRVLGEWMDLDLAAADKKSCVAALAEAFAGVNLQLEIQYLPPEEAAAFQALIDAHGRIPVATFAREHGDVRMMGPGALEREEPWYDPTSPAEALWYRGFIYRSFQDTNDGMVEFYYIPEEFLAQFPQEVKPKQKKAAAKAKPVAKAVEPPRFETAPRDAVDDVTTLLCLAQASPLPLDCYDTVRPYLRQRDSERFLLLLALAIQANLLRETELGFKPARPAAEWLKHDREKQLRSLATAWIKCRWNDLRHVPGLECEGSGWSNDSDAARLTLKSYLPEGNDWVRFDGLLNVVKENDPDFQRPDGDYDSWYIKETESGKFLRGFENWDRVEGALLRFMINGPLFWLGMVDIGLEAFRLTASGIAWHRGTKSPNNVKAAPLVVHNNGILEASNDTDRHTRFQASRIAHALPLENDGPYRYLLTPKSLALADEQGISGDRVAGFLQRAAGQTLPASIKRAIERWTQNGPEAKLQHAVVLRVRDADILEKLRANPKTRSFLGESLGDYAVLVKEGQWEEFRLATAQLGLFLDSF